MKPTRNSNGKDIVVTATATMGMKSGQAGKRNPTEAIRPKKESKKKLPFGSKMKAAAPPRKAAAPQRLAGAPPRKTAAPQQLAGAQPLQVEAPHQLAGAPPRKAVASSGAAVTPTLNVIKTPAVIEKPLKKKKKKEKKNYSASLKFEDLKEVTATRYAKKGRVSEAKPFS